MSANTPQTVFIRYVVDGNLNDSFGFRSMASIDARETQLGELLIAVYETQLVLAEIRTRFSGDILVMEVFIAPRVKEDAQDYARYLNRLIEKQQSNGRKVVGVEMELTHDMAIEIAQSIRFDPRVFRTVRVDGKFRHLEEID